MARYQVKPRGEVSKGSGNLLGENGRGPYRWSHVVKRHNALRQGTIYTQMGDGLDAQDSTKLRELCDTAGFEMRRVA